MMLNKDGQPKPHDEAARLDALLTATDVARLLCVATRTVWRLRDGDATFPRPVRVGTRCLRWLRCEVENYIERAPRA